jgi:hypothetical protein
VNIGASYSMHGPAVRGVYARNGPSSRSYNVRGASETAMVHGIGFIDVVPDGNDRLTRLIRS